MLKIMLRFMLASLANTRLTLHVPAFISTILPPPPPPTFLFPHFLTTKMVSFCYQGADSLEEGWKGMQHTYTSLKLS